MRTDEARRTIARRMHGLVTPIHETAYFADEPNEELAALGFTNYWDGYFASRAAALGAGASAQVVDAVFYNFAPGEVARHIPRVWDVVTPQQAHDAKTRGCVAAMRGALGDASDSPAVGRSADVLKQLAQAAPVHGRPLFAGLLAMPVPDEPLARLWHCATMLREHRGDGHNAALLTHGVGGLEAHALHAVSEGMKAEQFGRIWHLPAAQLAGIVESLRRRGIVDDEGAITDEGRALKQRVEDLTDDLAAPAYDGLDDDTLDTLTRDLEPIAAAMPRP